MTAQEKGKNPYFIVTRSAGGKVRVDMVSSAAELKKKENWVQEYFDELLAVIRDMRIAEKSSYAKIKDIFACSSVDYNPHDPVTRQFFATVQNKLFWAITAQTAAEIITCRADADKPYMGIRTWKNAPGGRVCKSDVFIAKNYLTAEEAHALEHLTEKFLDFAREQLPAAPLTLSDWSHMLDVFLHQHDYPLLPEEEEKTIFMTTEIVEREYTAFKHCL